MFSEHLETLRHHFIDCTYVKGIWNDLQALLNEDFKDDTKLFGHFEKMYGSSSDLPSIVTQRLLLTSHSCESTDIIDTTCETEVIRKTSEIQRIKYRTAKENSKLDRNFRIGTK